MKGARHFLLLSRIVCLAIICVCAPRLVLAEETKLLQRVIYVGHRANEFAPFLKQHFKQVETVSREQFNPTQAADFDVVLLDWPQTGVGNFSTNTPLGRREDWSRPTVLLGSAGLNLAVAWKLKGGAGCTCLAPVAYGLQTNHEIFKTPIPIEVTTTKVPTPNAFVSELKAPTTDVVPLVDHIRHYETVINDFSRGWCTYYYEFADVPEVEYFCGGINEKTPRASAVWRQGNLMHFGFEQSPAEMNATGRALLVNAIVYISRFSQDRPIDITPSVFGAEKVGESRRRAKNYLLGAHPDWALEVYADSTLASFNWRDHAAAQAWFETNGSWLHPGPTHLLEVDAEAKSLDVPFDSADFLPKLIVFLRDDKKRDTAALLLERYAPEGPGAKASVEAWEEWWQQNSPYLFYSELGCYRWYIDPLAKARKVPTKDLRGPARADVH